jgi:hypothetical protein
MSRMKEHVMNMQLPGAEPLPQPSLVEALANAQSEMRNPAFDKVNPHFKSKFASLAAVRDAVVPVLARHGVAMTQTYDLRDGAQVLLTTLYKGGETIVSAVPLPAYQQSQQWASATTYIRRVSLMAIAGVCGDEDDDAEEAVQVVRKAPQSAAPHGFDSWWADMGAVAQEGSDALKSAWMAAPVDYRSYVQSVYTAQWDTMKKLSAKAAS